VTVQGTIWPEKERCDAKKNRCVVKEELFCRKRNDVALKGNCVVPKCNGVAFKWADVTCKGIM